MCEPKVHRIQMQFTSSSFVPTGRMLQKTIWIISIRSESVDLFYTHIRERQIDFTTTL